MALPESPAAYEDCYDHFARAQASPNGIRINMPDYRQAYHMRSRLNQARAIERRQSMRIYPRDDHRYGKSENDKFRIRMLEAAENDGTYWVYIEPWIQETNGVEEL